MRLYEAIILSTLLYSADVWLLTATLTKRLNASHHRWQRSILGISWKDRVTNEEVRVRNGQHSMDDILSERRLHSAGLDMWYEWITSTYLDRRCTGRFRDLREVQVVRVQTGGAQSTRTCEGWESPGREWRCQLKTDQNGVQFIHLDAGWIKVKVKVNYTIQYIIQITYYTVQCSAVRIVVFHFESNRIE